MVLVIQHWQKYPVAYDWVVWDNSGKLIMIAKHMFHPNWLGDTGPSKASSAKVPWSAASFETSARKCCRRSTKTWSNCRKNCNVNQYDDILFKKKYYMWNDYHEIIPWTISVKTLFACEAKQPGFTGTKTGNFPGLFSHKNSQVFVDTYVSWFLGVWDNNVEWEKALMTSKHYWFLWCNMLISKNDGLRQWKGWHAILEMENKSHVWHHQAVIIDHY